MVIQIENLKARMRGVKLNDVQLFHASDEFHKLLEYTKELEEKIKINDALGCVIKWVVFGTIELVDNKEYLISDGVDVVEQAWDKENNSWYNKEYNNYKFVAEKPKPP